MALFKMVRRVRPWLALLVAVSLLAFGAMWQPARAVTQRALTVYPPAPAVEPVSITKLPLPPLPDSSGVCHNPTGCISDSYGNSQAGGWLPDNRAVTLKATYTGAPAAPDPASVYSGGQILLVKANGTRFANGDTWKCVTCGVPVANEVGVSPLIDYPQPFTDGIRIKAGANIIDCSPYPLDSPACTPAVTHVYPIHWQVTSDDSGSGGSMRETRLNPDQEHFSWSNASLSDFDTPYYGKLVFDPKPTTGTPLAPRYDLKNVYIMRARSELHPDVMLRPDPNDSSQLVFDPKYAVGENRGFTSDGQSLLGMCWWKSDNTDICATNLTTGVSTRLTSDPSYIDPVATSPDDKWTVGLETRYDNRFMFIAGLPGVPPIDNIMPQAGSTAEGGYRNGNHRFFQPFLYDRYPDRPGYDGQQINACTPPITEGTPNSVCDPNWGSQADPRWSPDGTKIVYGQDLVASPDCLGTTPVDCPTYTEAGGYHYRLLVATFTSRTGQPVVQVPPAPQSIPWGAPYVPPTPSSAPTVPTLVSMGITSTIPSGVYTLKGAFSGEAIIAIPHSLLAVTAVYSNYSDDGLNFINGTETVTSTVATVTWNSALVLSGAHNGSRITGPGGFTASVASALEGRLVYTGEMSTTLDGATYLPPTELR